MADSVYSLLITLCSFPLLLGLPLSVVQVQADEPRLLVSSFAPLPEGGVTGLQLNTDSGEFKLLNKCAEIPHPFFFDLSPEQDLLCSIHAETFGGARDEELAAWQFEPKSLHLQPIGRSSTQGTASCFVEFAANGGTVLVANYLTGSVVSFKASAARLSPAVSFFQHRGSSVNPARQQEPHAHCFVISPDGRFAIAADLGTDNLHCYRLNPETGALEPAAVSTVALPPGSGPRHLSFHPNQKSLSVINELACTITTLAWNARDGGMQTLQTISTLPKDFGGVSHCADLKFTPDGRFLYGTNRGHDSIAVYAVQTDGTLERKGLVDSRGAGPQNLAISEDGQILVCANMPGDSVVSFHIDPGNGSLKFASQVQLKSPSCIRFLK